MCDNFLITSYHSALLMMEQVAETVEKVTYCLLTLYKLLKDGGSNCSQGYLEGTRIPFYSIKRIFPSPQSSIKTVRKIKSLSCTNQFLGFRGVF
jgi:hypothetical protein